MVANPQPATVPWTALIGCPYGGCQGITHLFQRFPSSTPVRHLATCSRQLLVLLSATFSMFCDWSRISGVLCPCAFPYPQPPLRPSSGRRSRLRLPRSEPRRQPQPQSGQRYGGMHIRCTSSFFGGAVQQNSHALHFFILVTYVVS
jgi:hypothetical protein